MIEARNFAIELHLSCSFFQQAPRASNRRKQRVRNLHSKWIWEASTSTFLATLWVQSLLPLLHLLSNILKVNGLCMSTLEWGEASVYLHFYQYSLGSWDSSILRFRFSWSVLTLGFGWVINDTGGIPVTITESVWGYGLAAFLSRGWGQSTNHSASSPSPKTHSNVDKGHTLLSNGDSKMKYLTLPWRNLF